MLGNLMLCQDTKGGFTLVFSFHAFETLLVSNSKGNSFNYVFCIPTNLGNGVRILIA